MFIISKKTLLFFVLVTVLIISACSNSSNNSHIYIGESDNWQVTYQREAPFIVKYIGDEEIPEEITYEIDQGIKKTDGNDVLQDGELRINTEIEERNKNGIDVQIKWNGDSETIELIKQ